MSVFLALADAHRCIKSIAFFPTGDPRYKSTPPDEHFSRSPVDRNRPADEWLQIVMEQHPDLTNRTSTLGRCVPPLRNPGSVTRAHSVALFSSRKGADPAFMHACRPPLHASLQEPVGDAL